MYAKVRIRVNFREVTDYLSGIANRAADQSDWLRKSGRRIFREHQDEIWRKQGKVPGSPVDWVDWGKRYGNPKTNRHGPTGLSLMRAIIRSETSNWSGHKSDIMNDTGLMKNSIGPLIIGPDIFVWSPHDRIVAARDLDQMWNVENGIYNVKRKARIPDTKKLGKGSWMWITIPARPFCFATEPFADRLASNLSTYIHQGIRSTQAERISSSL
mgnify:CR=1 FL=1